MRRLWAFIAAAAGAGCSLLVSFDGLVAGADAGASDSAVSGDSRAVPRDATTATDAANAVDAADATSFCPQAGAVLCSDFDEVDASIPGPWDYSYAPGTGVITVSTAHAVSAPRSLLTQTDNSSSTSGLIKSVGFNSGVTLSFELWIDAIGGNPSVAAIKAGNAQLTLQPQSTYVDLLESLQDDDGGAQYEQTTGPALQDGAWVHIDLDVDFTALIARVVVNGALNLQRTLAFTSEWSSTKSASVSIGIGDSNSETIYFDNVTIRTR